MKLTVNTIDDAMRGNAFWLNPNSEAAAIVEEAARLGYIRRISHTQVEWKEEGIEAARRLGVKRAARVELIERSISGWSSAFVAVNDDGHFGFLPDNLTKPYMPVGGREALAGAWDSLVFRKWNAEGYRTKRPVRIK